MKRIIFGLTIGTMLGLGAASAYGALDLQAALKSGGLTIDTPSNSAQPAVLQNANYQVQPAIGL